MIGPLTSEFTEQDEPPLVLPEPQCRSIVMSDEEMSGGIKAAVNRARENGFQTRVTYSRGPWQHATQPTYVIKQCIRVVGTHSDGRAFIATWLSPNYPKPVKWSFNSAWIAGLLGLRTSTTLTSYVRGEEVE